VIGSRLSKNLAIREKTTVRRTVIIQSEFKELFEDAIAEGQGVPVLVVNFIALLELSRESLVEITQAEAYAPIYVRLSFTPQA
jgi:chromatin segregation and condensation protein Rec8/ScpA/Scc1 (kleisin family)